MLEEWRGSLEAAPSPPERLDSWKEIADYLSRDVRTVQRWEQTESLPIHRHFHQKRPTVFAYKAELEEWLESQAALLASEGNAEVPQSWLRSHWRACAVAVTTLGIGSLMGFIFIPDSSPPPAGPSFNAHPLTSYVGHEEEPTFSPLGDQVAFSWNGEEEGNHDIYVRQVAQETAHRLTTHPYRDYSPNWAPDGSFVAFLRDDPSGSASILLVPPLGGIEKELGRVISTPGPWGRQLDWSPDSKWLATRDSDESGTLYLVMISVETGDRRVLTRPPAGTVGDHSPAFSQEGNAIAFVRNMGEWVADLYLLQLTEDLQPEGVPERVTFDGRYTSSPTWFGRGTILIYSSGLWPDLRLWRIDTAQEGEPAPLVFAGEGVNSPDFSLRYHRLAYNRASLLANIWRMELDPSGTVTSPPERLIASSRFDWFPAYSPDGRKIVFSSHRSGTEELWVCDSDGQNPFALTAFGGSHAGAAAWSPDSEKIAFYLCIEGSCNIAVINAEVCIAQGLSCRGSASCMLQVTDSPFDDFLPSWSRDGQWLYFASRRSGDAEIWKVPAEGGEPVQVTRGGGLYGMESPDGKVLYFSRRPDQGIWMMPAEGGPEEKIVEGAYYRFSVTSKGIAYVRYKEAPQHRFVVHQYDFATREHRVLAEIPHRFAWGLSATQDGSTVIWAQFDREESDLVMVGNLRNLCR